MVSALRRAGDTREIQYVPGDFKLLIGKEGSGPDESFTLYLNNAYAEYLAAGVGKRRQIIRRYTLLPGESERAVEMDFATAKPNLLPRVRERYYHEQLKIMFRREGRGPTDDFPTRLVNEDLTVEVAIDLPDSIQIVSAKTLAGWKVTFDDALAIAKDNLWKRSVADFAEVSPGLYQSPWQDTHDASRIFLHDLIWQLPVRGAHVAMVPNRNLLLVTGAEDVDGLIRMAEIADAILVEPRPMTGIGFRLDGTKWASFLPPSDSPAYRPLRQTALRSSAMDYEQQTEDLNQLHEKTGEDVFVASFQLVRQVAGGRLLSWTSWVDGITNALMPRADVIAFGRVGDAGEATSLGFAEWKRVHGVAGDLMEPTGLYPPRYRVRRFPTEQQLRQMELREDLAAAGEGSPGRGES